MKRFGWLNFLKEVAKTKIWDMPGYNSIDSVRLTSCFNVLVSASEEKLFAESEWLDYEANKPK